MAIGWLSFVNGSRQETVFLPSITYGYLYVSNITVSGREDWVWAAVTFLGLLSASVVYVIGQSEHTIAETLEAVNGRARSIFSTLVIMQVFHMANSIIILGYLALQGEGGIIIGTLLFLQSALGLTTISAVLLDKFTPDST